MTKIAKGDNATANSNHYTRTQGFEFENFDRLAGILMRVKLQRKGDREAQEKRAHPRL